MAIFDSFSQASDECFLLPFLLNFELYLRFYFICNFFRNEKGSKRLMEFMADSIGCN